MRYYFVDQDRNDVVVDLNRVETLGTTSKFFFRDASGEKVLLSRRLAGKLFGSWDGVKWFKLTQLAPGETVVSNTVTYKMYRGFKPSGLFTGGAGALVTQMPGKVVKLMVKAGDRVEKGQTILILEAMKMENEIKAGVSGVVKSLLVQPGQPLESGVLMAEIEE
ncbi:MAG: acetyl-CoA carboxylase biotin carboxyl carrier protein subunit [Bacteriovoracia bacterium]